MNEFDEFFKSYQYTFQALGAIATALAVIISLMLAFLKNAEHIPKIKIVIRWATIIHQTIPRGQNPKYLVVDIINLGKFPVAIPYSFFRFKIPLQSGCHMINPLDAFVGDEWIVQRNYPVIINPRRTETFFISKAEALASESKDMIGSMGFFRKIRISNIHAEIVTEDGKLFKSKIDNSVIKSLSGNFTT